MGEYITLINGRDPAVLQLTKYIKIYCGDLPEIEKANIIMKEFTENVPFHCLWIAKYFQLLYNDFLH